MEAATSRPIRAVSTTPGARAQTRTASCRIRQPAIYARSTSTRSYSHRISSPSWCGSTVPTTLSWAPTTRSTWLSTTRSVTSLRSRSSTPRRSLPSPAGTRSGYWGYSSFLVTAGRAADSVTSPRKRGERGPRPVQWSLSRPAASSELLLRLDAQTVGDAFPLRDVGADQLAQLVGRAQLDLRGLRGERLLDLDVAQNRVDLAVESLDDRGRQSSRRHHGKP